MEGAEVNKFRLTNVFLLFLWIGEGLQAKPGLEALTGSPGGAPPCETSPPPLSPLPLIVSIGWLPQAWKEGPPLVERARIPDDFIINSPVPLINQWAKALPCATQLSHQMSSPPQWRTVLSPGLRADRETPSDSEDNSSQAPAQDR